jgi:hypothetical protein
MRDQMQNGTRMLSLLELFIYISPIGLYQSEMQLSENCFMLFTNLLRVRPWIKATEEEIHKVQPVCDSTEKVKCWNHGE